MTMKTRPKNLDLLSIRLPLPGKLSILHRVSGAGLFLMLPLLLCTLDYSLSSPVHFARIKLALALWPVKLIAVALIWAFMHHFCAGIRFLLLDLQIGLEKEAARQSAAVAFAFSLILSALIAWRLVL